MYLYFLLPLSLVNTVNSTIIQHLYLHIQVPLCPFGIDAIIICQYTI